MSNLETIQAQNVERAAKLLDKLVPGWHRKMRPQDLIMSDGSLCALGQLFGRNVEVSIAKELFPGIFNEYQPWHNGFAIGRDWFSKQTDCGKISVSDYRVLMSACDLSQTLKCHWAKEVADRVVQDETQANQPTKPKLPRAPLAPPTKRLRVKTKLGWRQRKHKKRDT